MKSRFPSIRFSLMLGIGGGVPSEESDIRLGDVVVSVPNEQHGGVIQCDFGKTTPSGLMQMGFLNKPPANLRTALSKLRAAYLRGQSDLSVCLSRATALSGFSRENAGPDELFESAYYHVGGSTCESCSNERVVQRTVRQSSEVIVHYGTIASGNQVIKDGIVRDKLSSQLGGVLCFEMEAAGLMDSFPCTVIRGISDYADSHKNKRWQRYAAAAAAAFARELVSTMPIAEEDSPDIIGEIIPDTSSSWSQRTQEHPKVDSRCQEVCESFYAHVEYDYQGGTNRTFNTKSYRSIYDIIYDNDQHFWGDTIKTLSDEANIEETEVREGARRWIHLPANNVRCTPLLSRKLHFLTTAF
jgi:nucleoside phosphorylase